MFGLSMKIRLIAAMWQLPASFQTIETTKPSYFYEGFVLYGAGTRNRTRDLLITSQLLYHLSYTGVSGRRL